MFGLLFVATFNSFGQTTMNENNTKIVSDKSNVADSLISSTEVNEFSDAVVYGDFEKVKKMIYNNPNIINSKDKYGFSALHNVMCEEQFEIVKYLINKGADVNIQNDQGIAPIHLACYVKNVELLIKAGANINMKDKEGNTPLSILTAEGEESIEVIRYLLLKGADRNIKNNYGEIPLDIARKRNEKVIIKLLEK